MPPTGRHDDVAELMHAAAGGDAQAAERLLPLVYEELHAAAARAMARERKGHTLGATALVHEAYLKLVGPRDVAFADRAHFHAAAAQAMRRILVDHARARASRGGVPIRLHEIGDVADLATADSGEILAVDEELARLEAEDPEAAEVVRLRFFAGLSVEDTARTLGLSPRTAARLWTYARAVLFQRLNRDGRPEP